MRWATVITLSAASTYTAGSSSSKSPERGALGEHQADREDHDAHRPRGDADLALHAERLGAGAGVADHQRGEHRDDDRGRRDAVAAAARSSPATAVSTIPSSMRSSVESRNAPNGVPLPDMRE